MFEDFDEINIFISKKYSPKSNARLLINKQNKV